MGKRCYPTPNMQTRLYRDKRCTCKMYHSKLHLCNLFLLAYLGIKTWPSMSQILQIYEDNYALIVSSKYNMTKYKYMKKNKTCKNSPTSKGLIIQKIYASEVSAHSTNSYTFFHVKIKNC